MSELKQMNVELGGSQASSRTDRSELDGPRDGTMYALDTQLDNLESLLSRLAVTLMPVSNAGASLNGPDGVPVAAPRSALHSQVQRLSNINEQFAGIISAVDL